MTNAPSTTQSADRYPTVLTAESLSGGNEDVVDANVAVVNAMFEELLDEDEISPAALRSYYVDFYLSQALAGGFAQYVFTAPEREEIDPYVREGLAGMGAAAHLDLFNRTVAAFGALTDTDVDTYLDGGSGWAAVGDTEEGDTDDAGTVEDDRGDDGAEGAVSDAVRRIEELDGEFESVLETEDIVALNAAWLRGQADLLVLADGDLEAHIAGRVSRISDLAERQAAAGRLLARAVTAETCLGRSIPFQQASQCFVCGFEHALNLVFETTPLSETERQRADGLVADKYAHPSWTERV